MTSPGSISSGSACRARPTARFYTVLLPVGQLHTGKEETHGIERDNAPQRHWLPRFRWRSIVVSKAKRMVNVSIALFARFAENNRIGGLVSMLAGNPPKTGLIIASPKISLPAQNKSLFVKI